MAIFQVATNTPPKSELIREWLHRQPWGPTSDEPVEPVGSFHLDDPEGEVGMQVFVVRAGTTLFQVALTYRDRPLPDAENSFLGEMEHSVLGTRFVYDAIGDERFIMVLAGVAVSGYGQALGFAHHEDRWYSVPDELLVRGTGMLTHRVPVDGFRVDASTEAEVVLRNDGIELTLIRRLDDRPPPAMGLTATWSGQPAPITLVTARELSA